MFGYGSSNQGSPAGTPFNALDGSGAAPYTVWAGFTQLNVPVFGDNFNFPLFRKLDLEASWRHDQYAGQLHGGTSNPRVAFTWGLSEDLGATIRGSWGTSFRFANAGEYSVVLSDANGAFNFPSQNPLQLNCAGGAPTPGSASADLFAAGFACGSAPGGVSWAGGPHPELRSFNSGLAGNGPLTFREGGTALAPETSLNYSIGFELAPLTFLKGLDLQATWYSVKISNVLQAFTNPNLDSATERFHHILPSDLGCGLAANAAPATCVPFELMVKAELADRNAPIDPSNITSVYWINDGSTVGSGFLKVDGIDWNASYDWDMERSRRLERRHHRHLLPAPVPSDADRRHGHRYLPSEHSGGGRYCAERRGNATQDELPGAAGLEQRRVERHRVHELFLAFLPKVACSAQCQQPMPGRGRYGGGRHVLLRHAANFHNIEPSFYTFDLSLGYDTGDTPTNNYLKNVTLQFTIKNLMGIHSPFEYGPSTSTRNVAAYDIIRSDSGRIIGFTVVKNW